MFKKKVLISILIVLIAMMMLFVPKTFGASLTISASNSNPTVGDSITIFGPNIEDFDIKIKYIKDVNNEKIDVARHPLEIIKIPCEKKVFKYDIIRKKFN